MDIYYDYENQAWVRHGVYQRCGHPASMTCVCYGLRHAGEPPTADIHARYAERMDNWAERRTA